MDEEHIKTALGQICAIQLEDEVCFRIISIAPIRKDDVYGGYRVGIEAIYDTIITPLSMDISAGDVITPHEVLYLFKTIFNDEKKIELWAYNIETVLAEKIETIFRRGVFNTRPRDFYDAYILSKTQSYDRTIFRKALGATARNRETTQQIKAISAIIKTIQNNDALKAQWRKYQREYAYANEISYEDVINAIKELTDVL